MEVRHLQLCCAPEDLVIPGVWSGWPCLRPQMSDSLSMIVYHAALPSRIIEVRCGQEEAPELEQ